MQYETVLKIGIFEVLNRWTKKPSSMLSFGKKLLSPVQQDVPVEIMVLGLLFSFHLTDVY
jgi:hypothetical protein